MSTTTRIRRGLAVAAATTALAATMAGAAHAATDPLEEPGLLVQLNIVWPGEPTSVGAVGCAAGQLRLYRDPTGARTLVGAIDFTDPDGDGTGGGTFLIPAWVPVDQDLEVEGWCDDPDVHLGTGTIWLMDPPPGQEAPPASGTFSTTTAAPGSTITFEGEACEIAGASAALALYPADGRGPGVPDLAIATGTGTVQDGAIAASIDLPASLPAGTYLLVPSCTDASGNTTKGWEPQLITVSSEPEPPTTTEVPAPATSTTTTPPTTTTTTAPTTPWHAPAATPVPSTIRYTG